MPKKKAIRLENDNINQSLNFHMKTTPFVRIKQSSSSLSDNFRDDTVDIDLDDNVSSLTLTDESELTKQKQATRNNGNNNDISLSPPSTDNKMILHTAEKPI